MRCGNRRPELVSMPRGSLTSSFTPIGGNLTRWSPTIRPSQEVPLSRRALITGITGQDGSYLAEHLLQQGYEVWGLVRGQANPHVSRLRKHIGDVKIVTGDLLDQGR